MPTTEQKELIRELRSQGRTYNDVAYILGVSRRTLFYWKEELQGELAWDEEADFEALRHQLLGSRASQAHRLADRLAAVNEELEKRSMADLSTSRLISLGESLRRQILKVTTPGRLTSPRSRDQLPAIPPAVDESTNPSIQPSLECNDGATSVQSDSGPSPSILESNNPPIQSDEPSIEPVGTVQSPSEPSPSVDPSNNPLILPPAIQPSSECNDSAKKVQTPTDASPPIHESTNPLLQPAGQCNDSAKKVQPVSEPPPSILESSNPSLPPSGGCNEGAKKVQSVSELPLIQESASHEPAS